MPRFLCDEMLGRLCRYLRAAGYDTLLAENGEPDAQLIKRAASDKRWLLTLDQKIIEHKAAADCVVTLPHGSLDAQAAALSARFHLDWLHRAFTRCLVDNTVLAEVTPEQRSRIPPDAHRPDDTFLACPACGRVYWRGSHYRRMKEKLARWQHQRGER